MSTDILLKELECPICHIHGQFVLDKLGDKEILKCKACSAVFEYFAKMKIFPRLVFDRVDREPFSYELNINGNLIIGRDPDDYNYVKIRMEHLHDLHSGTNTYIRNPFISRKHAKIVIMEEHKLVEENNIRKIVVRKKCFLKDLGSAFGTSVNNVLLEPNKLKELKDNDKIVLSPSSDLPLVAYYKE